MGGCLGGVLQLRRVPRLLTHVAGNIAKGVDPHVVTLALVGAGLLGATVWDLLTWWWGLPTSSSHALLGGLAGAAIAKAGVHSLDAPFFQKTGLFIIVSPIVGCILGLRHHEDA